MKISEYQFRECCFKNIPADGRKLVWEITHKCKFGCPYCFQTKKRQNNPIRILHPADFKAVIEKFSSLKIKDVLITGGEIFFIKDSLSEICDLLSNANLTYSFSTNIYCNQKFVKSLLELNPRAFNISIDPPINFNDVKIKKYFNSLEQVLIDCEKYAIPVKITGVVTKSTLFNLEKYLLHIVSLSKKYKSLSSLYVTHPYDIGFVRSDVRATETEIKKIFSKMDVPQKLKEIIKFVNFHRFNAPLQSCPAGNGVVHIEPNGDVYPCHLFANLPKETFLMGNILNDNIDEIDRRLTAFSKSSVEAIEEYKDNETCKTCKVVHKCGGGCLAEIVSIGQLIEPHLVCKKLKPPPPRVLFKPNEYVLPLETKYDDLTEVEEAEIKNHIIENLRKGHDLAHGFDHIECVVKYARYIGSKENADLRIVTAAAYFHDFEPRRKLIYEQHTEFSAQGAVTFLKKLGFMDSELNAVYNCIVSSSYGSHEVGHEPLSIEAKCVRDADWLDAIGSRGIARVFAFAAAHGCEELGRVEWPLDPPPKKRMSLIGPDPSPIYHFFSKLLWVKDKMATKSGKMIAESRHQRLVEFLKNYRSEMELDNFR